MSIGALLLKRALRIQSARRRGCRYRSDGRAQASGTQAITIFIFDKAACPLYCRDRLNENHFQRGGRCRLGGRDGTRTGSAIYVDIASGAYDIGAMPYDAAVHSRHLHDLWRRSDTPTSAVASRRDPPVPAWHVGDDGMPTRTNHLRDPAGARRRDAFAAAVLDRAHPYRTGAMAWADHRLSGCAPDLRMDRAGRLGLPSTADSSARRGEPATAQHPKLTVRRPFSP
jgi:hypothetical protein